MLRIAKRNYEGREQTQVFRATQFGFGPEEEFGERFGSDSAVVSDHGPDHFRAEAVREVRGLQ